MIRTAGRLEFEHVYFQAPEMTSGNQTHALQLRVAHREIGNTAQLSRPVAVAYGAPRIAKYATREDPATGVVNIEVIGENFARPVGGVSVGFLAIENNGATLIYHSTDAGVTWTHDSIA